MDTRCRIVRKKNWLAAVVRVAFFVGDIRSLVAALFTPRGCWMPNGQPPTRLYGRRTGAGPRAIVHQRRSLQARSKEAPVRLFSTLVP